MPRRVARRGVEAHPVVDDMGAVHQFGGTSFDDGQNAVFIVGIVGEIARLILMLPEIPFVFANKYFALGNVGTQRPSTSRVFQPTWSTCRWVQST